MNARKTCRLLTLWVMTGGMLIGMVLAEQMSLEQKLNKDIKISLNDVLITEALEKIVKETGVPIRLSDEAEYKLPYGKSTRLSVTLKGPASESLTQMLNEFFMRYAVGHDEIVIYPRAELQHILSRPSPRQLQVLKDIYTRPIRLYITDNVSATVNAALGQEVLISPISLHEDINRVLRKLAGEKAVPIRVAPDSGDIQYQDKLPLDEEGNELKEYPLPTGVIFPQLLLRDDMIMDQPFWYIPSIDLPNQIPEIRIIEQMDLEELKRRQLIDINFEDKMLLEIFQTLADRGNILYGKNAEIIPYLEEHMTVSIQNMTAMQAMCKIADMAKLHYDCEPDFGEFFIHKKAIPPQSDLLVVTDIDRQASPESVDRGPYVGKISIPMDGGKYYIEFMLRENDLNEQLKKLRSEKIREILNIQAKEDKPEQIPEEKD